MSFSSVQKSEIISQTLKNACCRKAMLQGMLVSRAELDHGMITLSLDGMDTAEFFGNLVFECYSKIVNISTSSKGGRCRIVSFASPAAEKYLNSFYSGEYYFTEKCSSCQSAFLRGLFLGGGRVSDPLKQYSLEFSLKSATERISEFFYELGLEPKISKKPKETVIYFRNSGQIEDFFALAGMNNTVFELMNAKIQGEIRNNVNRVANCETNNIGKAVSASVSQIKLIGELIEKGLISQLPDELVSTALLRMEHDDLSLSQLAAIITPPVTKSGLSHRLKKITELAEQLLKK